MRSIIRRFDGFLARRLGVFEFTDDKACILRIQYSNISHRVELPGYVINPGDPVINLHLWNDRMPLIPSSGPDIRWAIKSGRMFKHSLYALGAYIECNPALSNERAVGGVSALLTFQEGGNDHNLLTQYGFIVLPYHNPLGRFGVFWENFYSYWLMWTYNPASLRHRHLIRLQRTEFWMPTGEFIERFGNQEEGHQSSSMAARGE